MRDDVSEIARDKMRELRANEIRNVAGGLQVGIDPGLGALISAHMLCDTWWSADGTQNTTCVTF
jgi:hypothetical protein